MPKPTLVMMNSSRTKKKDGTIRPNTPYHRGDLRHTLIQAAVEILASRGSAALTLREVAREADVSHAAPYHHFPDKDSLLCAVAAHGHAWLRESMQALAAATPLPRDRLQAYGIAYARFAQENSSLFRLMHTREYSSEANRKQVQEAAFPTSEAMVADICLAISCSREEAQQIQLLLWSSLHGLVMLWLDGQLHWTGCTSIEPLALQVTQHLGRVLQMPQAET